MKARLLEDKSEKAKELVANALRSHNLLKKDLERLIDFLVFRAKVAVPYRSFLTLLYRALVRTNHLCNINKARPPLVARTPLTIE